MAPHIEFLSSGLLPVSSWHCVEENKTDSIRHVSYVEPAFGEHQKGATVPGVPKVLGRHGKAIHRLSPSHIPWPKIHAG